MRFSRSTARGWYSASKSTRAPSAMAWMLRTTRAALIPVSYQIQFHCTQILEPDMTEVKRPYDASGRRARADARRQAVVRAARELFERDGFRLTTITAVAAHAGVSPESIYKGFGSKAALAKAVFDVAIAGDH